MLAEVKSRVGAFAQDNMPMRTLDSLESLGYADLGVCDVGASTTEVAQEVGHHLGVTPYSAAEQLTAHAVASKGPNTYGGNYGFGELPLHTDLAHWYVPPRYVMLRCIVADPLVSTRVLHHRDVLRRLSAGAADRALVRPRRKLEGRIFLLRLYQKGIFRWDQLFLVPENDEARQVRDLMVASPTPFEAVDVRLDSPGRTIIIDNWSALHGRSAVQRAGSSQRRIERFYFASQAL
ncbi:Fe(II)-2OG oxygenase family protein [Burkholderia pseudomallei]|uniref:TauD/TfdA family dioxygenase n=1 Tax=Burkholderia pseudomallei TaxID=28450 RepID=UPI0005386813|nr:TauD/TfdA family dioxygenase [Burkholderia pseudomallei]KGU97365.1 taurine catabolism dioxygenase TauD, TfdA family protein [Burkholderia pseudomallei MSHR4372]